LAPGVMELPCCGRRVGEGLGVSAAVRV
jgi:hypothetical protein